MDGVIIDSEPIHFNIENEIFQELNISISKEEHHSYVGTSSLNMWQVIVSKHNIAGDAREIAKKQHALYMTYLLNEKDLHPIPGVIQLIKDLYHNGFKLVLASSSYMEVIEIVLEKFNISNYFMARVSGTELANSKPHPEIFLKSAKLANSQPTECVVIEDSRNGITSAKAAGIKCIGYLSPNSGMQDLSGADMIVKSFDQLNADVIKNI